MLSSCLHVLCAVVLCGCSTSSSPYRVADGLYCAGSYVQAEEVIKAEMKPDASAEHVLDNLYMGSAAFAARNYSAAVASFSSAESGLKEQDLQCVAGKGIGVVADVLSGGSGGYVAATYDETMMNLYQAFSFLAQGNIDRARVEFNRVNERQGRAAERNSAMIRRRQAAIDNAKSSKSNKDAIEVTKGAKCDGIADLERELRQWNPYADYMNPAAVFMCGAFLAVWGEDSSDSEKGIGYFKRAYGMHPSRVAANAISLMERRANAKVLPEDRDFVLVLFENGMGPVKEEIRKEMIIPYRYPIHVGISLPFLQHRPSAYDRLTVYDGSKCIGQTETIGVLDRVIAAEFEEDFKGAVARQLIGATIRVGVQIVALEALRRRLDDRVKKGKMDPFARDMALLTAGSALSSASSALTHADTRIWSTLPNNYQAAIVPRPASGAITVRNPSGTQIIAEIPLEQTPETEQTPRTTFVYAKVTTPGTPATVFAVKGR